MAVMFILSDSHRGGKVVCFAGGDFFLHFPPKNGIIERIDILRAGLFPGVGEGRGIG